MTRKQYLTDAQKLHLKHSIDTTGNQDSLIALALNEIDDLETKNATQAAMIRGITERAESAEKRCAELETLITEKDRWCTEFKTLVVAKDDMLRSAMCEMDLAAEALRAHGENYCAENKEKCSGRISRTLKITPSSIQACVEVERAVIEATMCLRNSGYDGPFIGEPVTTLFDALATLEKAEK